MRMIRIRIVAAGLIACGVAVLFAFQTLTGQTGTQGTLAFWVRDFDTGYSVPATITAQSAEAGRFGPLSLATDEFGRVQFSLSPGEYLFSISAPGYESSRTHFSSQAGKTLPVTINLNPLTEPPEIADESRSLRPGYTLVHSFIVDSVTGRPLANVRIHFQNAGVDAITNQRGYFSVSLVAPPPSQHEGVDIAATDTFTAQAAQYKTYVAKNILLPDGGDSGFKLDLEKGAGTDEHDCDRQSHLRTLYDELGRLQPDEHYGSYQQKTELVSQRRQSFMGFLGPS